MAEQNPPFIHETALVEDGAALGDGTKVWMNAQVRSGANVGGVN